MSAPHRILFVCHGNICRSTMAEFVMKDLVSRRGMADAFVIGSAATHDDEIGSPVHHGTRAVLDHAKAEYDLDAVYFGSRNAVLDYNDVSVHTAKDTLCEMHTAGVLTGSASKILRGTIDFRRGAKRSVGHESEDVLLFSPTARNRTAPLILCGEEEVEGQHAASIGRLDEEKLYYLRSRGLSEAQARRLMVDARFAPALDKIPLEALREEVRAEAARRLDEDAE